MVLVALLLSLPSAAQQKDQKELRVPNGFLSSQQFVELPEERQRAYVMGYVDGIRESVMFGVDGAKVGALHECLGGMKASQIAAIITKYLREHPEKWHWDAKLTADNALLNVCPGLQQMFRSATH
jgi:hypothetical protein